MISFEDLIERYDVIPVDDPDELNKQQEADLLWLEENMSKSQTNNTRK